MTTSLPTSPLHTLSLPLCTAPPSPRPSSATSARSRIDGARHVYHNPRGIERPLSTHPFNPFRILTADGRQYDVRHPESIALAGKGRLIAIGTDDHFVPLAPLLTTAIERPIPKRQPRLRRSA